MKIKRFVYRLYLTIAVMTPSAAFSAGDAVDEEVARIFRQKCTVCHDDRPGDAGSDLERLLDFEWLADPDQGFIGESLEDSYLVEVIHTNDMPREDWKGIKWGGPLTEEEKSTIISWVQRGGPSEEYRRNVVRPPSREKLSETQIVDAISRDLSGLSGSALKNARYLTISNLHNQASVTEDRLNLYREGMVKMLNSLSRSPDILGMPDSEAPNTVIPIDEASTVYRFDLRHIGWQADDWEKVVRHYPYGLKMNSGGGRIVGTLTDSEFPYMRADWFVFATSQAPLYHDLVGISSSLEDLESSLGIDRLENIRRFLVARAGFGNSRVSVNNRLVERHTFSGGYYHISYDFFRNNGDANLFDFPLGPPEAFETDFAFQHDGGEVIYTLPNGFQAYALVTASGQRISIAPSAIVHDDSMSQIGSVILNGISCISCHYDGMKPENPARLENFDEIRKRTLNNFRRFKREDRSLISRLYPEQKEFKKLIEGDRSSWRQALKTAGMTRTGSAEPVRALFDSFVRNLDVEVAAAEFGLTPDDLLSKMERESETRQLSFRLAQGGMQRQLFVEEFRKIAELTGFGSPKSFEPLLVPWFGHNPDANTKKEDAVAEPEQRPEDPAPQTEAEANLVTEGNQAADFRVVITNPDDRKVFIDGESIPVGIRADQECFITVLAIAPNGEVSSLVPNQRHFESDRTLWWSPLKLRPNRTLKISLESVGFEFFAQPPHGATKIRVIATRRKPLKLRFSDRMAAELKADGIPTLGFHKGAGVRFGQAPNSVQPDDAPTVPSNMTQDALKKLFPANDWATAEWTFLTRPRLRLE